MALLAAGSLANVYASLDAYLQAHLVEGAGLTVRAHGVRRFVPPVDAPWVEVHYDFLGMQSEFRRQTGRYHDNALVYASEQIGYLQLNLYQRARLWAQRYTTAATRDLVVAAFPEGKVIEIWDYATTQGPSPEVVGALILDEKRETVVDTGMSSGLTQHVVQVRTRYLEHYTR